MNIEELNERIKQLTELVVSASETIEKTEEMIKVAEQERDRLADQRREQEPKFERVGKCEPYWTLTLDGAAYGCECTEHGENCFDDTDNFESNNYFKTEQRAQEVADKFNFLLKLERFHDMFCPDYVPNWSEQDETRFAIYFDVTNKRYGSCYSLYAQEICGVYFPSKEIAQKVCDILNAELEGTYEN